MRALWPTMLLFACSGEGVELDDGQTSPTDDVDCAGAEAFTAGMSAVSSSGLTVSIVQATPTPPDVGDNTWTVQVDDGGTPVDGLGVDIRPWMPLHGHGLSPATYDAAEAGAGSYELDTFDLIMPGTWEFTVDLAAGGDTPDTVVFALCAEG